jgi:hypothetical protein
MYVHIHVHVIILCMLAILRILFYALLCWQILGDHWFQFKYATLFAVRLWR